MRLARGKRVCQSVCLPSSRVDPPLFSACRRSVGAALLVLQYGTQTELTLLCSYTSAPACSRFLCRFVSPCGSDRLNYYCSAVGMQSETATARVRKHNLTGLGAKKSKFGIAVSTHFQFCLRSWCLLRNKNPLVCSFLLSAF